MAVICVTGNTAAGTTTLTRRLHQVCGWPVGFSEGFLRASPFFARFFESPCRWAFQNQVFFLGEYFEAYDRAVGDGRSPGSHLCLDYAVQELLVYTDSMFQMGYLDAEERAAVDRIFRMLESHSTAPDIIVHVRAPCDVLSRRIRERGRQPEQKYDHEYLTTLQTCFERWTAQWVNCPQLQVDSATTDFRQDDETVRKIADDVVRIMGLRDPSD